MIAFAPLACSDAASTSADASALGETTIRWTGNNNGVSVLDANGNAFLFSDGCMYGAQNGAGPAHFCLTPSAAHASGYAPYGATNCANPSSNSDCDSASFSVALTNDPQNLTGCIAVLTNAGAASLSGQPLAITETTTGGTVSVGSGSSTSTLTGSASSFEIQVDPTPSAYKVYWNGVVPICGDDGPYAGTYSGTLTAAGSSVTFLVSLTVDSGDLVNDDASRTTGSLTGTGSGSFSGTYSCGSACAAPVDFTVTVTGATKNAAGKEVLHGNASSAGDNADWTFSATQQ